MFWQIAKRRSTNFGLMTKAKMYKHLEFFYHTQIKGVVEFSNSEGNELFTHHIYFGVFVRKYCA